jgi:NAD(P)-dependent dehydrogenase (short-subunit alcohol dehydrogenase family)
MMKIMAAPWHRRVRIPEAAYIDLVISIGKASVMAKTFLITGVSSGFGRALAEAALRGGHIVAGTLRNDADKQKFEALGKNAHAVVLDVTHTVAIAPAVAEIEKKIGAIDVLVNNAGYGHEGILEESSIDDLRRQFEVNVFGAVAMIQAVLPFMRARRAGISSTSPQWAASSRCRD